MDDIGAIVDFIAERPREDLQQPIPKGNQPPGTPTFDFQVGGEVLPEPVAIRPRVDIEHGMMIMASKRAEPLTNGTFKSFSACWATSFGTSNFPSSWTATCLAWELMTRCTS